MPRYVVMERTGIAFLCLAAALAACTPAREVELEEPRPPTPEAPNTEPSGRSAVPLPLPAPNEPGGPRARGPAPKSECTTNADCGAGMVCQSQIWAACDVCDGGVAYTTCSPS